MAGTINIENCQDCGWSHITTNVGLFKTWVKLCTGEEWKEEGIKIETSKVEETMKRFEGWVKLVEEAREMYEMELEGNRPQS